MSSRCVVIEIGDSEIRGGFAGDPSPWFTLHQSYHTFGDDRVVWSERLHQLLVKHMLVKPKQQSVLIVENMMNTRKVRDLMTTVLLRDLQVQAVSLQPNLLMAMLSSGCNSGVVLHFGDKATQAMCFVDNRPLIQTWKEASVGTTNIEKWVGRKVGHDLRREAITDLLKGKPVTVVEGSDPLVLSPEDNRAAMECLLTGHTEDGECVDENGGAAGLILSSLKACNHDVRLRAANNIIIVGEGSGIPGLAEAICTTATQLAAEDADYVDSVHSAIGKLPEGRLLPVPHLFPRPDLVWVGGSIFASLKESKAAFVTLQDLLATRTAAEVSGSKNSGSGAVRTHSRTATAAAATTTASTGSSSSSTAGSGAASLVLPEGYLLRAPDWQSLDQQDWVFCRTTTTAAATMT